MRNRTRTTILASALIYIATISTTPLWASPSALSYTNVVPPSKHVLIDVSPAALCEKSTVKGATCLPVEDLLGPHRRLANISGLLWLLGTAGLNGSEHVVIVGNNATRRDFVAGLIYLAGQNRVSVLTKSVRALLKAGTDSAAGFSRSKTREKVYQSLMRSDQIALRGEMLPSIRSNTPPVILDGRSEAEYWGNSTRTSRGGHVPGAQHSASSEWAHKAGTNAPLLITGPVIAYAHDSFDSVAYFTRLTAAGVEARVYLKGWTDWASSDAIPVDAETFPGRPAKPVTQPATLKHSLAQPSRFSTTSIALFLVTIAIAGFFTGRMTAGRT